MKTRLLFLLTFCFLCCSAAWAQRVAKGQVVSDNENEPLIGVAVVEKGTSNGTITDIDGNFSLNVQNNATLVFSYVGYTTQEAKPTGAPMAIRLVEDNKLLDDVVVIGYGVQKKSDLTGAVASVKGDDLKNLSTTDAAASLQGKAAGVQIINSGSPGGGAEIRVRGYSSNSGNIGPLLIVDGLKVDNIQYLDPSMIESMEVLKDAASAAIYGAQAGNGVVIITTKTGAANKGTARVSYGLKAAKQSLGKKAELFNAADYIEYQTYIGNLSQDVLNTKGYKGQDTDWYNEVFEGSWSVQHNVTVQGGNDKGHFLAAINLFDNDGIVKGNKDTYKRFTAQVNADYNFFKWLNITSNTSVEKWSRKSVGNGYASFLNSVVSIDPLTSAYVTSLDDMGIGMKDQWNSNEETHGFVPVAEDGRWYGTSKFVEDATGNPLGQRDRSNGTGSGVNVRGTLAANITPMKGLVFTSRLGYRITQSNNHDFGVPYWLSSMAHAEKYTISASTNAGLYYQWENFINYNKTFAEKHNVGAMVGMSFTKNHSDNTNVSSEDSKQILLGNGIPSYRYINYLLSDAPKTVGNAPNDATELAYFGRLTYSYDNRYSLQANFRADAFDSSKLSKKARWGYFPSFSAGWTISNETFFKEHVSRSAVSFLKLRGSWGRNGNVNVLSGYKYNSTVGEGAYYYFDPQRNDGTLTNGAKPSGLPNEDLQWETSEQLDFGLDARFLDDRLTFGLDWYKKQTKDLLIDVAPVPELGVSSSTINTGKVLNQGFDIELGWKDKIGDLHYSINANFSTLKNEVKEVSELVSRIDREPISGFNSQLRPTFEKGHPVWYMRGYKYAGVDPQTGAAQYYDKDGKITSAPGQEDKQDIGAAIPNFTYGITLNLEYKGFDLTVFGTGAAGNKIYNLMVSADRPQINGINTYWKNSTKVDAQGKVTELGKYPDMKQVYTSWIFYSSDAAVFSGAFFKIKQIQLGYTVPKKISKLALMNELRFSVSLDDYFTFTKYPGADPETSSLNSGSSRGMDNGNYPTSKKLVFGVNVTF